jgi:hypothetical protein
MLVYINYLNYLGFELLCFTRHTILKTAGNRQVREAREVPEVSRFLNTGLDVEALQLFR